MKGQSILWKRTKVCCHGHLLPGRWTLTIANLDWSSAVIEEQDLIEPKVSSFYGCFHYNFLNCYEGWGRCCTCTTNENYCFLQVLCFISKTTFRLLSSESSNFDDKLSIFYGNVPRSLVTLVLRRSVVVIESFVVLAN